MTPTRLPTLALTALLAAAFAYLLARLGYGQLPPLPAFAPVPLVLLALFDGALALVVRGGRRGTGKPAGALHPLQVARAAVLAKASSAGGALLLGAYGGLLAYVLPLAAEQTRADALVSAASLAASLALVAAALLLERACRTPGPPRPPAGEAGPGDRLAG